MLLWQCQYSLSFSDDGQVENKLASKSNKRSDHAFHLISVHTKLSPAESLWKVWDVNEYQLAHAHIK